MQVALSLVIFSKVSGDGLRDSDTNNRPVQCEDNLSPFFMGFANDFVFLQNLHIFYSAVQN